MGNRNIRIGSEQEWQEISNYDEAFAKWKATAILIEGEPLVVIHLKGEKGYVLGCALPVEEAIQLGSELIHHAYTAKDAKDDMDEAIKRKSN